jgi:hypothetical protein
MKANKTIPSLGVLAVAALLSTSPAQACMDGGMPFFSSGSGSSSCATAQAPAQAKPQSCPQPGNQGQSCGLVNPELMAAVGDMAAGGMQIATHMMRVLAEEVSRYAAVSDGVK